MWKDVKLTNLLKIVRQAGTEILSVYSHTNNYNVSYKEDNSPVTEADRLANNLIVRALKKLPSKLPILSEESEYVPFSERESWEDYWLIDPLDGTREFIKRNGEFTVNIALVRKGVPEMGVVHVPVSGVTYLGKRGDGAWRVEEDDIVKEIHSREIEPPCGFLKIVASRSHHNDPLASLIQDIPKEIQVEVVSMGSSLKICLLAEGEADLYPRLAPTCEWDTAAAHAVLKAAGGEIFDTAFRPLKYNQKADLLNPHFFAVADTNFDWKKLFSN